MIVCERTAYDDTWAYMLDDLALTGGLAWDETTMHYVTQPFVKVFLLELNIHYAWRVWKIIFFFSIFAQHNAIPVEN